MGQRLKRVGYWKASDAYTTRLVRALQWELLSKERALTRRLSGGFIFVKSTKKQLLRPFPLANVTKRVILYKSEEERLCIGKQDKEELP